MDLGEDFVKIAKSASPTPIALDGGWGWVVVCGAFLAYFIADGWAYSFGIIFPNLIEHFHEGKGKTAIIGALLYGMPLLISPLVCALTTVYGCRKIAVIGGVITGLSFILSAFAKSVDFLCFSTGILASFGLSMTYIPALVIVTYYFERRRGLATGLAVTGSGLGAFAFPPLLSWLLQQYNWHGALLLLGGICFNIVVAGLLFRPPPMTTDHLDIHKLEEGQEGQGREHLKRSANILMPRLHQNTKTALRNRTQSTSALDTKPENSQKSTVSLATVGQGQREAGSPDNSCLLREGEQALSSPDIYHQVLSSNYTPTDHQQLTISPLQQTWIETKTVVTSMLDRSLLSNWPYLMYWAHNFILFLWIGVPYVYLVDYAGNVLTGISQSQAAFLLSIIGISRTFGQLFLGFLGDNKRFSTTTLYGAAIFIAGISVALVPVHRSYVTLCLYSTLFGFFVSVTYSLQMMCVVEMVGIQRSTNAFGLMQLAQGIATLLGTPVAGWLFDATGTYDPSFYIAGGFIIVSALLVVPVPLMLRSTVPQPQNDPNQDITVA